MSTEHHLVVRHPFGDYARGDVITDPDTVEKLKAESADHVLKITPPVATEQK